MSNTVDITVPALAQGLDEILLLGWEVETGQRVERGAVVATAETAKAAQDLVAERAGVIEEVIAKPGTILRVGDLLYRLSPE